MKRHNPNLPLPPMIEDVPAVAPEGPDPLAALKTPEFKERVTYVVISGLMDLVEASQAAGTRVERNFESLGLPKPTAAHVHHCAAHLFRKLVDQMVESLHG